MADIGGLQLLPETRKKVEVKTPGQYKTIVVAVVFVTLVVAIWFGLYLNKQHILNVIALVNSEIKVVEDARSIADEEKLLLLKSNILAAKPVIANHPIWSTVFERVQKLVLPQTQFESLAVKLANGEYTFKAFGASFVTVAKQIAAFNSDDAIDNVEIGKITANPDGRVEFSFKLNLNLAKINIKSK